MRGLVTSGLLVLLAAGTSEAQPPTPSATGHELLAAADTLGAAEAFQASLRAGSLSRFTVQLAIYCDVSNLERQVSASGNPPELFVLRREVTGRPCLGLYWGLFASRDEARRAVSRVPAVLRAAGQAPVAVSAILPPGEPAPPRVATAPAPPVAAPMPTPPPAVVVPAQPEARPAEPPVSPAPPVPPPAVTLPAPEESPAPMAPTPAPRVPALELAAGYGYLHDDAFPVGGGDFEIGWVFSGVANLNRGLGVVGEASGQYAAVDSPDRPGSPFEVDLGLLAVHAGLRYAHPGSGFATPYIQGLAGVTRSSVELAGRREVEDDFSIQPGAGLVFRLSGGVGLGLGGDYRLVFGEADQRNEFRLHADLVFGIGNR